MCIFKTFGQKPCISQVLWDPIKNHVSPRSALFETVYLEALLYLITTVQSCFCPITSAVLAYSCCLEVLKVCSEITATLHCWQSSSILSHFAQPMGLKNITVLFRLLSFLLAFVLHKSQFSNYFANIRY